MLTISKPPIFKVSETDQDNTRVWTIQKQRNKIFALPIHPKFTIMSFKKDTDAHLTASIIESHFMIHKQWPELSTDPQFDTKCFESAPLEFLHLECWDLNELKLWSVYNFFDLGVIENMKKTKSGYRFKSIKYNLDMPIEFYKERLNYLFDLNEESMPDS